jgi:hypothetical protein
VEYERQLQVISNPKTTTNKVDENKLSKADYAETNRKDNAIPTSRNAVLRLKAAFRDG